MKNNIIENWKAVPGYENYEVSDLGNVRSLNYKLSGKSKALKPRINSGYLCLGLYKNGEERKFFSIQRLVFSAFNGPIPPDMVIDHINDIKTDNRLENLQLLTRADNTRKSCKGKKRKPLSDETKAKMSSAKKGKKHSEETKAKISKSMKARRELTI